MSPETAKALERVRKLLALAGNNTNEHEAAQAAERAQAILAEHNMTIADVHTSTREDSEIIEDDSLITTAQPWRHPIGGMVARLFFCEYLYADEPHHRESHCFFGQRHNVEVAKLFFTYLHMTVLRLSQEGARKHPPRLRSPYRTEFRRACADRIAMRLWKRIEAAKAGAVPKEGGSGNLPALLDVYENTQKQLKAWILNEYGEASTKPTIARKVPVKRKVEGAEEEGRRAGDAIGLDTQLQKDKPSGLLGN